MEAPSMALLLSLISTMLMHFLFVGTEATASSDLPILLNIKRGLSDPYHYLQSWNTNSPNPPCDFQGIQCDQTKNHVTGIDLGTTFIEGPFPSIVCSLKHLTFLSLANNSITGVIPNDLVNCSGLRHLDLSQNYLVGPLPSFISGLSSLEYLDLSSNNFSGPIPPAFGKLGKLQTLNLEYNLLGDRIPGFLANLTSLVELHLANNPFDIGFIPSEFGNLTKLQQLWLRSCNLHGEIPHSIGGMAELRNLDVSMNTLTGFVPPEITRLANLKSLELYVNNLMGEIPDEIGKMKSLERLDASHNILRGTLPESLVNLTGLASLHLYENKLTGEIPAGIAALPMLKELALFNNFFTGQIPQNLGSNGHFEWIDLSFNQLSGSLPSQLCNGEKLQSLVLINNKLNGIIPEQYGSCGSLSRLRLSNNQFSGEIPKGLWGLQRVYMLDLSSNGFEGSISAEISSAGNLSKLHINNNRFSGKLPSDIGKVWTLSVLKASNNKFSGSLPEELGRLHNMQTLDLQGNLLSGTISSSIGSLEQLVVLNLRGNGFSGVVPAEIGELQSLVYLDLSNNHFSGQIPLSLATIKLGFLNLSNNQFSGSIPKGLNKYRGSFSDNPNLCGEGFTGIKHCIFDRKDHQLRTWTLCGILVSAAMILVLGLGCFYNKYYHRANGEDKEKHDIGPWNVVSFHKKIFQESEIMDSLVETNMIASGGAGKIYKVNLSSGETVAVKRLPGKAKVEASGNDNGFNAEVEILGKIRHRNIVKLWCCLSGEDCNLLVYEYMSNGSLGDLLHGPKAGNLDWPTRHKIALDAAQGLSYLHHDYLPPIVHRDIKSNNILLDDNLEARVADFGLAKILEKCEKGYETMSAVAGSYGYIAPEFSYTLKITKKSDVYSFGVVLLELVTGKLPVDPAYGEGVNIVKWVGRMLERKDGLREVLDARISDCYKDVMHVVLKIALLCTSSLPTNRPSMKTVVDMLQDANPCQKSKALSPRNGRSYRNEISSIK